RLGQVDDADPARGEPIDERGEDRHAGHCMVRCVDPTGFRRLFPIFGEKGYLNSCSQGALGEPVQAALEEVMASWHGQGNPWELWCERMEELRVEFAGLVNAEPDEVAVTFSASSAVGALASALDWSERPRVVTSDFDFPTMGHVWLAQRTRGA